MDYYDLIFKRKSFHLFRDIGKISEKELDDLKDFIKTIKPLDPKIKTSIQIVLEKETTSMRGGEYCLMFYSEPKGNYLGNIGYLGEQIDLYLAHKNIGTLWFGIGKVKQNALEGMDFIIMMVIAKMPEEKFRKDMFKAKRKPLDEIWQGELLPLSDIIRFAPSACNSQPWLIKNEHRELTLFRYKKPGKRGIMPIKKVTYYNRIDMGIMLCFLEICLQHEQITYQRTLFEDNQDDELVVFAKYKISKSC